MNPLREDHEELYGVLLAADQVVDDSGGCWMLCAAASIGIGLIVGLELGWFEDVFGVDLIGLRHWSVYLGIAVATFLGFGALIGLTETLAYRRAHAEIHIETQRAGISWNALLTRTSDDPALKHVAEQLRKDKNTGSTQKY